MTDTNKKATIGLFGFANNNLILYNDNKYQK